MGHKGVSKRKPPQAKIKPLATANRGIGPVSGLSQSKSMPGQLPERAGNAPLRQGGAIPSSGSKKKHKKH